MPRIITLYLIGQITKIIFLTLIVLFSVLFLNEFTVYLERVSSGELYPELLILVSIFLTTSRNAWLGIIISFFILFNKAWLILLFLFFLFISFPYLLNNLNFIPENITTFFNNLIPYNLRSKFLNL